MTVAVDVLCVGHAAYDLVLTVENHPGPDEKTMAQQLLSCGGGPAANAAVTVARLGCRAAFAGYLGNDLYGCKHFEELNSEGVHTGWIVRGEMPTPLSVILVKPDGRRTVVNYRSETGKLDGDAIDVTACSPGVMLFDGHEQHASERLLEHAGQLGVPTVLDAGSVHAGTEKLASLVDYLVASETFCRDVTGKDPEEGLDALQKVCSRVVVTRGDKGILWKTPDGSGRVEAFAIEARDTTGAGDAFHGAFAAGLARGLLWHEVLVHASAAGALCCTGYGARPSIPRAQEVTAFMREHT